MRIIKAGRVRKGDVVRLPESLLRYLVKSVGRPDGPTGKLYIEATGGGLIIGEDKELELMHRPRPHGKTDIDLYNQVGRALNIASQAFQTDQRLEQLAHLRDEIDDYLMALQ